MVLQVLRLQEPIQLNSQMILILIPKYCPKIRFVVYFLAWNSIDSNVIHET